MTDLKQQYEREGGPDLHPTRKNDTGITLGDVLKILAVLLIVAILYAR